MSRPPRHARPCERCQVPAQRCVCKDFDVIESRLPLLILSHYRQQRAPDATGGLVAAALQSAQQRLHGLRPPLDLQPLLRGKRAYCLFPADDARPLSELCPEDIELLVVPDASWKQSRRMLRALPDLAALPRVTLSGQPPERLTTLEAVARALEQVGTQRHAKQLRDLGKRAFPDAGPEPVPAREEELPLLYRDDSLVAVHKPAGIAVHKGWDRGPRPLMQRLRDQLGQWVYPLHRLDRGTSGVLLFGLSEAIAQRAEVSFREGQVDKRYIALCRGSEELGPLNHPLRIDGRAVEARTEFRRLATWGRYGLYEARPLTGRTHQIRRHLKHLSHPIIGDVRYGKGEHNRLFREEHDFHRLALHCAQMSLPHPLSGEELRIEAPLEGAFAQLVETLFGLPVETIGSAHDMGE